jgi:hypothetical protein
MSSAAPFPRTVLMGSKIRHFAISTSDKARYVALGVVAGTPERLYARLPQYAAGVLRCTAFVRGRRGTPACAWGRVGRSTRAWAVWD